MKKVLLLFVLISSFIGICRAEEEPTFVPFYSFNFSEGGNVPSIEDSSFFMSMDLVNDLGFIAKPFEEHTIMGLYELKYNGPGFKRQEGHEFMERSIDHILFLQDSWKFADWLTIKFKGDYIFEYFRAGTNETLGEGKYDYNRYGGEARAETNFLGMKESVGIQYHYMNFPNDTDLSQAPSDSTAAIEGGLNNQSIYGVSAVIERGLNKLSIQQDIQMYNKQKIIQSDGSLSSTDKQLDMVTSMSLESAFGRTLVFMPGISARFKRSNQNYRQVKLNNVTQLLDSYFGSKYYDFNQFNINATLMWRINSDNEIFITPEYEMKFYTDRKPKNANEIPIEGQTQNNCLTVVTVGYSLKWNDASRWLLYYNYFDQKSNMLYIGTIPYNYSGQAVGMRFSFAY